MHTGRSVDAETPHPGGEHGGQQPAGRAGFVHVAGQRIHRAAVRLPAHAGNRVFALPGADDARPGSPEDRHRAFQILAFEHAAHHGIPLSEGRAHNHAMRYRLRRRSLYCDHHSNPLAADEKTKRAANPPFAAPDQRLS